MPDLPRIEGAETARRVLRLMELVSRAAEPIGLDELVRRTELNKSTVYRLLRVLQDETYIERADGGGYLVGSRMVALAAAVTPDFDAYDRCRPILRELADESGETSTMHRRAGDRAVLVLGAETTIHPLRRVLTAGELTPLTRGSAGTALLASLPATDTEDHLAGHDAAEVKRARRALRNIQRDGYVMSFGENHPGLNGVAAPVVGAEMSVSVSGPDARWTRERMEAFAPRLLEGTAAIAAQLKGSRIR
jgi:IclR family transcriptional regulator, acetate operon repressor